MKIKSYRKCTGHRWAKRFGCALLSGILIFSGAVPSGATSVSKTEKEKKEAEQNLDSANRKAQEAERSKTEAQSKVTQLSSELADILAVIQVLEGDLEQKESEIKQAQSDYDAAKIQEDKQYQAMKKRIQYMYEKGDTEYLEIFLQVKSISDLLNKAEYAQELYSYDRRMLSVYQETKEEVKNLQSQLEEEKAEMEVMEVEYKDQQSNLEVLIAKKKKEVSDFDSQMAIAKQEAAQYARAVEEKTAQLRKAKEEEARKRAEEEARRQAAAKSTSSSKKYVNSGPGAVKSSGGTAQGRAVADYALQFVGNPYVYGGTSLTNGADCSGFTLSVYSRFGISLPRTSSEQSRFGQAVSYDDIQAGDLVFYAGHVAIYIGGGRIVHASSRKTGIKVSDVGYRTILGIRRVL